MSKWHIEVSEDAKKDLAKLDRPVRRQILDRLAWLSENFDNVTPLPLGGPWKGFFKFRVGDWRVVYTLDYSKRKLKVHYIDHRDKIYKRNK